MKNSSKKKRVAHLIVLAQFFDFDNATSVMDICSFEQMMVTIGHLFDGNVNSLKKEYHFYCKFLKEKHIRRYYEIDANEMPKEKKKRLHSQDPVRDWEDPVRDWEKNLKTLPNLAPLVILVLSIPASSAEVERSFSKHKALVSDKRLNLSEEKIKEIRYIQHNFDYFN
jgi:hypothetical protein